MYYKQLNGFRCLFVFLVLIEHLLPHWVYQHLETGSLGVNLFFVLSGFLIGESLLLEKVKTTSIRKSLYNFFAKRTLRIFPLYYLVILLYGLFFTTGNILGWNLLYATNFLLSIHPEMMRPEFAHLWSLCVEEQFYLFFPFLVFFLPFRFIKPFLIIAILSAVCLRFTITAIGIWNYENIAYTLLPACFDCLLGGVALAYLKCFNYDALSNFFKKKYWTKSIIILLLISLLLLKIQSSEVLKITFFRFNSALLGILLIGYSVMVGFSGTLKRLLENKVVSYLGKISYGIYLFHPFIKQIYYHLLPVEKLLTVVRYIPKLEFNIYLVHFVLITFFTIIISTISYELYERQFLKLKRFFK